MFTIYSGFGYNLSPSERFKLIKGAGFDGVLLLWSNEFNNEGYRDYPEQARKAGLFVENIHAPFSAANNLWMDNLSGDGATEQLLRCVEDCADFEIPTMVVHLTNGYSPPPSRLGLDRIKHVADKAERLSVNVALENLSKTEYLNFVLDQVNSERIGFCYDSGHHNCWAKDENMLIKYGSRLMALHLHDNDGNDDQHRLPFDGTVDWAAVMSKIAQTGYKENIALEVMNWAYKDLPVECFLEIAWERAERLTQLMT